MTTDESLLPGLVQQLVRDIEDTECFYWIYSNYFDTQPPTERTVLRWHHTPLFLNYDRSGEPALWNAELAEDGILFDAILKNQLPAERERIKLEYAQIAYSLWRVALEQNRQYYLLPKRSRQYDLQCPDKFNASPSYE